MQGRGWVVEWIALHRSTCITGIVIAERPQPAKNAKTKGKKPAFTAYHVQPAAEEGGQARWLKVGVYFAHDGKGGTLCLDALPIHFDGSIVLRAPKAE